MKINFTDLAGSMDNSNLPSHTLYADLGKHPQVGGSNLDRVREPAGPEACAPILGRGWTRNVR